MGFKEEYSELFDKYAQGTISKAEKIKLRLLIKENPELELEFKTQKLLVEGIKLARKEELKEYLKEHGKVEYFQNIWGKKWRSASAVIVLLFTCSFFVAQYLSKKAARDLAVANKENAIGQDKLNKSGETSLSNGDPLLEEYAQNNSSQDTLYTKEAEGKTKRDALVYKYEVIEDMSDSLEQMDPPLPDNLSEYKPAQVAKGKKEEFNELPVAEEIKIFDTILFAHAPQIIDPSKKGALKSSEKPRITSDSKNNKDRLEEVEQDNTRKKNDTLVTKKVQTQKPSPIPVEIWKSPLNFKGYQYITTLKVYGVKKENISIISYANELYLKVNTQYCKLNKSKEYLPFKFITDPILIQKLNGH